MHEFETAADEINKKFDPMLVEKLFSNIINGKTLGQIVESHNAWTIASRKEFDEDDISPNEDDIEERNERHKAPFWPFMFFLHQINVYKTHLFAISSWNMHSGDEKIKWGILALETRVFLVFDIPEKEIRKTRAKLGEVISFFKLKHPEIQI